MKVKRLQIGVYSNRGNQLPFCLYSFPLVASSPQDGQDATSRTLIYSPFYRLRDIDVMFFDKDDFIFKSGEIPQVYIDTPGYCFHERSGDIFLAARVISDTATRLGNHLLAEFTKLGKSDILAGLGDRYLEEVSLVRERPVEAEFEFFTTDSSLVSQSAATPTQAQVSPRISSPRSPPQVSGTKRMSLENVLDDNESSNNRRGTPMIKQEPSPANSGSEHSAHSSPNHSPRSPHSSASRNAQGDSIIDDDARSRKKRRVVTPTIGTNNIKVTNNPEVMEQVRSTLKLKQQQKAIIEARQYQAQQQLLLQNFVDRRHSVSSYNNTMSLRSRQATANRNDRNTRNLSVYAPPYNHTQVGSRGQISTDIPMTAPITRSTSNRQSFSGYPQSANSAFRSTVQVQGAHSASTSASINGLISPSNVEIRPINMSSTNSSNPNSPMYLSNGEQPSKESFVNLFDNFYDTVADTHSLKSTLEDQIRKTTTLLQTLQASGTMIESLVRGHFREMQREVFKDIMILEKRLSKIEERMRHGTSSAGMSPSPPLDHDRRLSNTSVASNDLSYNNRDRTEVTKDGSSQFLSVRQPTHTSPSLSDVSLRNGAEESQPQDYQDVLSALKTRLESLESRMSIP